MLRQIIDLGDTEKSQQFATTEFNNCFIIRSSSLFFVIIFGKSLSDSSGKRFVIFMLRAWFQLRMSRILFAAKPSWTVLCVSRPLFVGSYLQVTWFALGQWKGGKSSSNDKKSCSNSWWWNAEEAWPLKWKLFSGNFFWYSWYEWSHTFFHRRKLRTLL